MTTLRDAGSSTSGTAGTKVAEITAGSGKKLVHWSLIAGHGNVASTQLKTIVTYTDDTTTEVNSATGNYLARGNAGGIMRSGAAMTNLSAKDIKNIRVETLGTGTGKRYATLSATEVDTTATLRSSGAVGSATDGTVVATITADSGNALVGWNAFVSPSPITGCLARITITYADATTTEVDITSANEILHANAGGVLRVFFSGAGNLVTNLSAKDVTKVEVTTLGTPTNARYATISAEQATLAGTTILRSAGSSTSATTGTLVAEIEAASGNWFYAPTIFVAQTNTSSTATRTIITYTDNTTSTSDTNNGTAAHNLGNVGGMVRNSSFAPDQVTAFDNTGKNIKKIRVETLNAGSGTRYAAIAALEASAGGGSGDIASIRGVTNANIASVRVAKANIASIRGVTML